jgi:hypothetical protein
MKKRTEVDEEKRAKATLLVVLSGTMIPFAVAVISIAIANWVVDKEFAAVCSGELGLLVGIFSILVAYIKGLFD